MLISFDRCDLDCEIVSVVRPEYIAVMLFLWQMINEAVMLNKHCRIAARVE